jgi:Ca-activated chloride channel family protein
MSFQAPIFLAGLVLVPLLAWAYWANQRRRAHAAEAFALAPVQPSVVPRRPGWRRHVPMAAYALALAALVVALARPETTVAVPDERASIMLVTDISGSMQATDVRPSRLVAARDAAEDFLSTIPRDIRVGAMAFNQRPRVLSAPTTDRAVVRAALRRLEPSGGTATGDALTAALAILQRQRGAPGSNEPPPSAIVLLSDGESVRGADPVQVARTAAERKVPIYTIALGTDSGTIQAPGANGQTETRRVPPDREAMSQVAQISGGETFEVSDADALAAVYEKLGSQVATKMEERQVTAWWAGGAIALAAVGAAFSLAWFGRLP